VTDDLKYITMEIKESIRDESEVPSRPKGHARQDESCSDASDRCGVINEEEQSNDQCTNKNSKHSNSREELPRASCKTACEEA
jgi:hypothetical protein